MPLFVFRCREGHESELLRPRDTELVSCACGLPARRAEVNRIGFSGFATTPGSQIDFRDDYRRFTEATSETDYRASKFEYNEGVEVKTPNYYQAMKPVAQKMADAGVTADSIHT